MTLSGLLNLYKPAGPTSHDLVDAVRRGARIKKVGHAGTLDPLASGVLVLCLGSATRLSEYVMSSPKTYRARLHWGVVTNTYDTEGVVIAQSDRLPERAAVEAALDAFRGEIQQVPPMHSAVKQGGKRLYKLARAGHEVERAPRPVTIFRLELLSWEPPFATLEIDCSPGTYIRSLAHDLGQAVGVGAHLAALERRASGVFTVEQAVPWAGFLNALRDGTWHKYVLPPDLALAEAAALHLAPEQAQQVRQGQSIPAADDAPGDLARAYDPGGQFFAVLRRRGPAWQPDKVLGESPEHP